MLVFFFQSFYLSIFGIYNNIYIYKYYSFRFKKKELDEIEVNFYMFILYIKNKQ